MQDSRSNSELGGRERSRYPDGRWTRLIWIGMLLPVKVRDVITALEADGWRLVRTKRSHRQFRHPSKPGTVTVAGKLSIDVPIGTLGSIWKQAGLKKD